MVMVLLKRVLENVAALISQSNAQNGLSGMPIGEGQNGVNGHGGDVNGINGSHPDSFGYSISEIDAIRQQEVTAKAVSGILILLLKWFKVSRKCSMYWTAYNASNLLRHP